MDCLYSQRMKGQKTDNILKSEVSLFSKIQVPWDVTPCQRSSSSLTFFLYSWDRASLDMEVVYITNKMQQIHNLYC
jgi:hypothetical protein